MKKRILIVVVCTSVIGIFPVNSLVYANEGTQALKQQINTLDKKVQELGKALQEKSEYPYVSSGQGWNPFWEMGRMQAQMNKMFKNNFGQELGRKGFYKFNKGEFYDVNADIYETKDHYIVKMDLPGMDKAEINIETLGDRLVISGERKSQTEENNETQHYYKKERSFGYFLRSVPLPGNADKSAISAEYKNGVLTVKIPKIESSKPKDHRKKIKIN